MVYEHRTSKPMLAAVQFGRVIDAANSFLSREQRTLLNSPILYTNRVDPLPYYSNLDTVFFYLSSGVPPEKFMLRYRPEFVTINGYTQNPDETGSLPYPPEILSRLHKSYTGTSPVQYRSVGITLVAFSLYYGQNPSSIGQIT